MYLQLFSPSFFPWRGNASLFPSAPPPPTTGREQCPCGTSIDFLDIFGLQELPTPATVHVELLQPTEDHHDHENDFASVAPPAHEANPPVRASRFRLQLPSAAVPHREPHVPVSAGKVLKKKKGRKPTFKTTTFILNKY